MFGKKALSHDTIVHIAEVSEGSGMDYFAAALRSEGSDRAAYLVLAHLQVASSAMLWAQAAQQDESLASSAERAASLEKRLRSQLFQFTAQCFAANPAAPFPDDEVLKVMAERTTSFEPVALKIGVQAAWEAPFANVHNANQ